MITDALLNLGLAVVQFFWALVPAWSITVPPTVVHDLKAGLSNWDQLFPVTELMVIITAVGAVFGAMLAFKFIVKLVDWIMDIIP